MPWSEGLSFPLIFFSSGQGCSSGVIHISKATGVDRSQRLQMTIWMVPSRVFQDSVSTDDSELSRRIFLNSWETVKQMLMRLSSETLSSTSLEIVKQKVSFSWFHDVFMGRISQVLPCLAPWVTVLEDTSRQAGRRGKAHWCPSGWTMSTEWEEMARLVTFPILCSIFGPVSSQLGWGFCLDVCSKACWDLFGESNNSLPQVSRKGAMI